MPAQVELSIPIRTLVMVAATVAVAWALASVADVLLIILVSLFSVAVLSPVVGAMERSGWRRGLAAAVLVLAIVVLGAVVVFVLAHAVSGAVSSSTTICSAAAIGTPMIAPISPNSAPKASTLASTVKPETCAALPMIVGWRT